MHTQSSEQTSQQNDKISFAVMTLPSYYQYALGYAASIALTSETKRLWRKSSHSKEHNSSGESKSCSQDSHTPTFP